MAIGLDGLGIALLVRELDPLIKGQVVQSIRMDFETVLTITLAGPGPGYLRFLTDPTFTLVAVTVDTGRRRKKSEPPPMPRFEEPLVGLAVSGVEQIDLDRVIRIGVGDEGGRPYHLYFELTPPRPNLFLTDGEGKILATLFKAGTRTRRRTLAHGEQYTPPVPQDKADPFKVKAEDLDALPWREDDQSLSKAVRGIGPFLSKEITWRAGNYGSLAKAFREMISNHSKREIRPAVCIVSPLVTSTLPWIAVVWYTSSAPWVANQVPGLSLNMAAGVAMKMFIEASTLERKRAAVAKVVKRQARRWSKAEREAKKAEAEKATSEELKRFGETLIANLKAIRRGSAMVRLPNAYSEAGEEVTIPLEPHLSPQANAEAYFKKARKSRKRAELAHGNLIAARKRLRELRDLENELTSGEITLKRLEELEDLCARGRPETPADEKAERLGIKPRRYTVTGGWTVLVGRSAKENDVLTHRYATPSDLWFHARQAQGSHVVLKRGKKKTQVPRQAILEAAGIAAHYSKARTSKHVPVSYTERRYIKKVRKGPPGQCIMLREKVVFVEPSLPK
jgi:predicted ribosome quality control (RQC) complex YloA/Tae2 family protein